MKKHNINIELEVYDSIEDCEPQVISLMQAAVQARKDAYAPYSRFQVGAAIKLANGKVATGNNQENAAYPSGLCAERVAIFHAGAIYPGIEMDMMAITATSLDKPMTIPVPPCGACRQSIAEYEVKQEKSIKIYFMGESGKVACASSISDLLPLLFKAEFLS